MRLRMNRRRLQLLGRRRRKVPLGGQGVGTLSLPLPLPYAIVVAVVVAVELPLALRGVSFIYMETYRRRRTILVGRISSSSLAPTPGSHSTISNAMGTMFHWRSKSRFSFFCGWVSQWELQTSAPDNPNKAAAIVKTSVEMLAR